MRQEFPRRSNLDSLKKEAKKWLAALRDGVASARDRLKSALPSAPAVPTLRDVQLALAREHGFPGWTALKRALTPDASVSARTLAHYEAMAEALLEAYMTGSPAAMERHYRYTWHRRHWQAMRTYVQLDLGRRPAGPDDPAPISIEDARYLVAFEYGFENWDGLRAFAASMPGQLTITAKPLRVGSVQSSRRPRVVGMSREWDAVLRVLAQTPSSALDGAGQLTDAMLKDLGNVSTLVALNLSGSRAVTDEGLRHLAALPGLRYLDLSGTPITDAGLEVLARLPRLETLSLGGTRVTDAGAPHLAHGHQLRELSLEWTEMGDLALRALAGKAHLRALRTGRRTSDEGLRLLHELPAFKTWNGGDEDTVALFGADQGPNQLTLRGSLTDGGMRHLQGLDGLYALDLDDSRLALTADAMKPLIVLPRLGRLSVPATDVWMPHIAAMPHLRFLTAQDTPAGDDGFVALSRSPSIEGIWGRRCHNLRRRGFLALAEMPALRTLSVSCLNVDDEGIAALPRFPALRELMPMDVPDAGYRHIGQCSGLESLVLMYCRDTTDAATEHIVTLPKLSYYFNSYTTITDRTPELLSQMEALERVTFDQCHNLTDSGVAKLARLPRLREVRVAGRRITDAVGSLFPPTVAINPETDD